MIRLPPSRAVMPACAFLLLSTVLLTPFVAAWEDPADLPRIVTHDNLVPAGQLQDGVLTLRLELREGAWHPDADDGPYLPVLAFGEAGGPPSIPGPLIRVPQGTEIHVSVRNLLSLPAVVHGLNQRPGDAKDVLKIPPGETREARFPSGAAGTYYYWATTGEREVAVNARSPEDTQLDGAFIVDPPGAPRDDRILVIGLWYRWLVPFDFAHGFHEVLTVNGKSWPHTTRLTYTQGETAHWRVINASVSDHPMHLHGAFYRVDSVGDAERDTIYAPDQRRMVVTENMLPGSTMAVSWTPEYAGNWIFHCHLTVHFAPELASSVAEVMGVPPGEAHHETAGMAGLVVGIHVLPSKQAQAVAPAGALRQITMTLRDRPAAASVHKCISVELREGTRSAATPASAESGPPLVLYRGQPTEITVVNQLPQPTAIHWHGMELESYYDGVPGVTGDSRQVTPAIAPGTSFVARMTPEHAGTYIYHTHWHDVAQLTSGLYGPMIVLEPGQKYDPATDKVFLVGRGGPDDAKDPVLLNGSSTPPAQEWKAGTKYRVRLINMTPFNGAMQFSLLAGNAPVEWLPVGKDGADLPPSQQVARSARQTVSVGETYDFEYQPRRAGELTLDLFRPADQSHVKIGVQVR